jgi:hypothetical protein
MLIYGKSRSAVSLCLMCVACQFSAASKHCLSSHVCHSIICSQQTPVLLSHGRQTSSIKNAVTLVLMYGKSRSTANLFLTCVSSNFLLPTNTASFVSWETASTRSSYWSTEALNQQCKYICIIKLLRRSTQNRGTPMKSCSA